MADQADLAISFISQNGPVLPVQIAKRLETEILFAGAILSDLVSRKKLKTTKRPIGGSPIYYLPGQESLLEQRLYPVLKGKEKEAYDLLKEKKVIWERELEPWQRVAYADLKDFAFKIDVSIDQDKTTSFWKFHLITELEANEMIKSMMKDILPNLRAPKKEVVEEVKKEPEVEKVEPEIIKEVKKPEVKEEVITPIKEIQEQGVSKETINTLRKELLNELRSQIQPQKNVQEQVKKTPEPELTGAFYEKISKIFNDKDFKVLKKELVRKEKEFDFVLTIPSSIGRLRYYAKATDKAKLNEKDLSLALTEAHARKLRAIFISPGELSKKGKEFLAKHQDNIIFHKI